MKKKLTYNRANNYIFPALVYIARTKYKELIESGISESTKKHIKDNHKVFDALIKEYSEEKKDVFERFCKFGDTGQPDIEKFGDGHRYKFESKSVKAACDQELKELDEKTREVTIHPLMLSELQKLPFFNLEFEMALEELIVPGELTFSENGADKKLTTKS